MGDVPVYKSISIHTPAKGVTPILSLPHRFCFHFNPHSREGSDTMCNKILSEVYDFNPHSREGSDSDIEEHLDFTTISIHTPAKGVTRAVGSSPVSLADFNPHSREGSDEFP